MDLKSSTVILSALREILMIKIGITVLLIIVKHEIINESRLHGNILEQQINLAHGENILGDIKAAKKILSMFINKLPDYLEEIKSLRDTEAWIQFHEAIHALKGASSYSSTPSLNETVSKINALVHQVDQQALNKDAIAEIDQLLTILFQQGKDVIQQASPVLNDT